MFSSTLRVEFTFCGEDGFIIFKEDCFSWRRKGKAIGHNLEKTGNVVNHTEWFWNPTRKLKSRGNKIRKLK